MLTRRDQHKASQCLSFIETGLRLLLGKNTPQTTNGSVTGRDPSVAHIKNKSTTKHAKIPLLRNEDALIEQLFHVYHIFTK